MEADTKAILLAKAKELFDAQGFEETSLDQIAESCGVRKATLLGYYGSKADLGRLTGYIESTQDYYTRKGQQARRKLRNKSNGSLYKTRDLAREALKMRAQYGWSVPQIAKALGRTERRIYQVMRQYQDELDMATRPKVPEERYLRMLDWTLEAFEAFFLAFSPESYLPAHVKPWIRAFLRERRLMLNVPPRHAKSIFFMVWLPIWLICRDRNVQILLVSNAAEDAKTWALDIAGNLELNEGLIAAYGRFKGDKTEDTKWMPKSGTFTVLGRTKTVKGAQFTVESRGMTQRVLGREADFVFVDDPTNQEEAESESERRKQLAHLREQVFTRAEPEGEKPGGRICVIGQRVHLLDLYGELERQEYEIGPLKGEKLWHVEKYPAILDWDTQRVLWPERFSWDELMLTYASVGGHIPFSTMYQQEPLPEGASKFYKGWLEACFDRTRPAFQGVRADAMPQLPVVRVLSVDPSPTQYNGIVVGDMLYDRSTYHFVVTEMHRMKASIRELKAEVDRILRDARPDYFIFEESGFLNWFRDDPWFIELSNRVRFIRHHTGVNKNSMEYGLESLAGDFELGHISLPYGDEVGRRMTDMFVAEAITYPYGDTTDLLMAMWFPKPNRKMLAPVGALPTRIKGGTRPGWSFISQMKDARNTDDAAYRQWQRHKEQLRKELTKVG